MKCIGERNMHLYLWWLFAENFKHFFLLIMSCAGCSTNVISGALFLFASACALGVSIYFIVDAIKWVVSNRINTFQTRKQIIKDMIHYLFSPEFPPSKLIETNKITHCKDQIISRSKDDILLSLSTKKIQNAKSKRSGNISQLTRSNMKLTTDESLYQNSMYKDSANSGKKYLDQSPKIHIRSDLLYNPEKLMNHKSSKQKINTEGSRVNNKQKEIDEEDKDDEFDLYALLKADPTESRNKGLNKNYFSTRNNNGSTKY